MVVLIPIFPFFKTVNAFDRELFEVPFPIINKGSLAIQAIDEVEVESL